MKLKKYFLRVSLDLEILILMSMKIIQLIKPRSQYYKRSFSPNPLAHKVKLRNLETKTIIFSLNEYIYFGKNKKKLFKDSVPEFKSVNESKYLFNTDHQVIKY